MRRLVALFVVFAATSALASQPGQPLDCSDWVFFEPGLACTTAIPRGQCLYEPYPGSGFVTRKACAPTGADSFLPDGRLIGLETTIFPAACGDRDLHRFELVAYRGQQREILGYIETRCVSAPRLDFVALGGPAIDQSSGRIRLTMTSKCSSVSATEPNPSPCPADYDGDGTEETDPDQQGMSGTDISGFATLFDILQSFAPDRTTLGFRTPYMPEGMNGADHFDNYWGAVTQPLDLANARPLQCSYPPSPPSVGDYLQITATVPTPAPGSANYVLTSATYQGQTRAGRKASGGKLTGRDASRLPACIVE